MPIPALIGASLISGATSSLGSIINGMAQARENARARDFSREMFDTQSIKQLSTLITDSLMTVNLCLIGLFHVQNKIIHLIPLI